MVWNLQFLLLAYLEAVDYSENPFKIENSRIIIGSKYEVDFVTFADFTTYAMTGGFAGWANRGIPPEAHENLEKLAHSVNTMTQP